MMHLIELKKRIDNGGPYVWIEPHLIKGVDKNSVLQKNKTRWLNQSIDDIETEDEIIADYLWDCLVDQTSLRKKDELNFDVKKINSIDLINASVYLINEMGSSYAATLLSIFRDIVLPEELEECIGILKLAIRQTDDFRLNILESFILELFQKCNYPELKTITLSRRKIDDVDFNTTDLDDY